MSDTQSWTIGRLLQWTTDFLKEKDAASPRLDAELLLAAARGCQRIELYTSYDDEPSQEIRVRFRELVRRRANGEPVAYLVGQREFYSLPFHVSRDVLIPRPETEFILVALFDLIEAREAIARPWRIVDVGTGSGALAVCVSKKLSSCQVTAIDVSTSALAVACSNVERHRVADQVEVIESDLFAELGERRFDYVISNPPYVSRAEMAALPREVADFEPHLALDGGDDGTEVIERLIEQSASRIEPGGALIFEISPMIEDRVRALLRNQGRYGEPRVIKDLAGFPRIVVASLA